MFRLLPAGPVLLETMLAASLYPALAILFRVAPTRVSPIATLKEDSHQWLGAPNWRGASEEQGI